MANPLAGYAGYQPKTIINKSMVGQKPVPDLTVLRQGETIPGPVQGTNVNPIDLNFGKTPAPLGHIGAGSVGHIANGKDLTVGTQTNNTTDPRLAVTIQEAAKKAGDYYNPMKSIMDRTNRALFGRMDKDGGKHLGLNSYMPMLQGGFDMWSGYKNMQLAEQGLEDQQNATNFNMQNSAMNAQANMQTARSQELAALGYGGQRSYDMGHDASVGAQYTDLANKHKVG